MRLGAEHLGSRLPVVAMVINGSNSGSLPSLYATSATHSRHGMKTASVVVSSSFLRGLKNDHFWSKKGEGRLFCFKRGQSTSRGMRGQRFTILGLFHDVYGVVV
jgi:hypothetical protein